MKTCKKGYAILKTPFESPAGGWEEYPRPQLKRESYYSLCGPWRLYSENSFIGTVNVPFPPESRLSGIDMPWQKDRIYVYEKAFEREEALSGDRVILHFGAVDQVAKVELNCIFIGTHTGGYLPFSFDVTDAITDGENVLRVTVTDTLDPDLGYGKQCQRRGGMWYTPHRALPMD